MALLLGGGRASATGAMLWQDINLANGRFEVGRDKTDAGMRRSTCCRCCARF